MFIIRFLDGEIYDACSRVKELLIDDFIGNYGGIYELRGNDFYEYDSNIQVAEIIELYELK